MKGEILAMLLPGMFLWCSLHAQRAPKSSSLTEAEWEGKKMFQQRCSICHTPPNTGDKTYGPMLNADSVIGKETLVREVLRKGTARMPGFQYGLQLEEIDNIIAYLKTVKKSGPKKQQD